MKLELFKISAFVAGTLPLLLGTDAAAFPGPPGPPGPPPGGPPHLPAGGPPGLPGGGPPMGLSGPPRGGPPMRPSGPPRGGGFNHPSVPGGGFRGGPGPHAPNLSRPSPGRPGGLAPNGKLAGGGPGPGPRTPSRAPNIARPGPGRPGGLAPNRKLAGGGPGPRGGGPGAEFPSKIQPLPKGAGLGLPSIAGVAALGSIAQGKLPGAGPQGKGFPDLAGKGPSQLVNSAQAPVANQQFWKNWS